MVHLNEISYFELIVAYHFVLMYYFTKLKDNILKWNEQENIKNIFREFGFKN